VENFEDLLFVSLRVLENFVLGQLLAGYGSPGRIADKPGEITDEENRDVAEILEVFHLPDQDGMSHMDIRCGRIETSLDAQGFAVNLRAFQFLAQLFFANDVDRTPPDVVELFCDGNCFEVHHLTIIRRPSSSHRPERTNSIASE